MAASSLKSLPTGKIKLLSFHHKENIRSFHQVSSQYKYYRKRRQQHRKQGMSKGIVSIGSQVSVHNCNRPYLPTTKPILEPCTHLSFNTHNSKPSFSLKTQSGSYRTKPKATINSVYMATESTFYDLLGISEKGTLLEIKQAYKQLARKYHPDVSPPDLTKEYTKRFIQVQVAYETLSDPKTRALYDKDLSMGLHMAFSARKQFQYNQKFDDIGEWRNQWQSQVTELKRRSMSKDLTGNMSWGARMRSQRSENS